MRRRRNAPAKPGHVRAFLVQLAASRRRFRVTCSPGWRLVMAVSPTFFLFGFAAYKGISFGVSAIWAAAWLNSSVGEVQPALPPKKAGITPKEKRHGMALYGQATRYFRL